MSDLNEDYSTSPAYRRGMVLGFTVAEIILLVLFALLLALVGSLISNKNAVEKAAILNTKFDSAIKALDRNDSKTFEIKVNELIENEINYEKKLNEIQKKLGQQPLPDDVYAELVSNQIDLKTVEGKEKLLNLLLTALAAEKAVAEGAGITNQELIQTACESGLELQNALGKDQKLSDFLTDSKKSQAQSEYWKSEAAKCGLGGVLPPCYRDSVSDPTPFIYEAKINNDGIRLINTVPDKYRDRFNSDFSNQPSTNVSLSPTELISSTKQFLDYGQKNECRFYVKVYDELANDKDKFKKYLKSVETNFYKKQTW